MNKNELLNDAKQYIADQFKISGDDNGWIEGWIHGFSDPQANNSDELRTELLEFLDNLRQNSLRQSWTAEQLAEELSHSGNCPVIVGLDVDGNEIRFYDIQFVTPGKDHEVTIINISEEAKHSF